MNTLPGRKRAVPPAAASPSIPDPVPPGLERRAAWIMVGILVSEAVALFFMLRGTPPSFWLSLISLRLGGLAAWGLGALVALAYCALSMRSLPLIRAQLLRPTPIKLIAIPFSLVAAALEELFFRRWLMNEVAHAGMGWPLQILLSAVTFGLAHAIWGVFGGSWRAVRSPLIFTTGLGAALAVVYLLAGRDVAPCFWSHAAINLVLEPALLVAVMARHRPRPT